jgi:hypothetical protein
MITKALSIAAVGLTLGMFAVPASAAPISSLQGVTADRTTSIAESVAYRRCWWHHGYRHCRWVGGWGYGPSFRFGHWRHHRHW